MRGLEGGEGGEISFFRLCKIGTDLEVDEFSPHHRHHQHPIIMTVSVVGVDMYQNAHWTNLEFQLKKKIEQKRPWIIKKHFSVQWMFI